MLRATKYKILLFVLTVLIATWVAIPVPTFDKPYSQVIYDRSGELLGAKIALDEQWRFPIITQVPLNFQNAICAFEDKRFFSHFGIDLKAIGRAIITNFKAKRVVSGASTLTMQICRMARGDTPRTFPQKILEMAMAIKAESYYNKEELLRIYTSHAPFGGNVVGLEAASWRYYSKPVQNLSIAEAATLAVLPNAPKLIHPGKNRHRLLEKRNRLLHKMRSLNIIDEIELSLALLEEIPARPRPLPNIAPHFLEHLRRTDPDTKVTTIDYEFQKMANLIANDFHLDYRQSEIENIAVLILDTKSGETLAYVGNAKDATQEKAVDLIQAKRSSGSVLKPFLHALALDDGLITPHGLIEDVPVDYNGYRPKNYSKQFSGAVPANLALSKSLNIPAVNLLKKYNTERFLNKLKQLGISSINKNADHYGLSLILGSGEVSLWQLCSAYASLARILDRYKNDQSRYKAADVFPAKVNFQKTNNSNYSYSATHISAGAIHHTFDAMKQVLRPTAEGDWEAFNSAKNIAWKTGTSYGHRDAWAIGVSPEYTIGVWVGNADGEGRHNLVGVKKAAPVLFDLFNSLPAVSEFEIPYDDLEKTIICKKSGYKATSNCDEKETVYQIFNDGFSNCQYHKEVWLNKEGMQVNKACANHEQMEKKNWFILPTKMAHYYRKQDPSYQNIPPIDPSCNTNRSQEVMRFIYPNHAAKILLPKDASGNQETALFKIAHQNPKKTVFWHLNENYLGKTIGQHNMPIVDKAGEHQIKLIDEDGNSITQVFEILEN